MLSKSLMKKVSGLTILMLTCSSLVSLDSLASESNSEDSKVENLLNNSYPSDNQLDDHVLSKDFDLEKEVENMPSVDEMNKEERELFNSIIEEQAELAGLESEKEKEVFTEYLSAFFNKDSQIYNNLTLAQKKVEGEINDIPLDEESNNEKVSVASTISRTFTVETAHAFQPRIGVNFAGATFNTAIGFAVGGGVGAIQGFIAKKGKKEAAKLFSRTVTSRLKAWGFTKLALSVNGAVQWALNYSDVGGHIARYLDAHDSKPKNGWIDL